MMRLLGLVSFAVACCAITARTAGNEPTISISMVSAGQEGPLQIVGFKPMQEDYPTPALHIRNTSNKATSDYWVEPLIRSARGELWHFSNGHAAVRPGEGVIPAGGEAWDQNTGGLRLTWAMVAKDLNSTCLRITPVVMEVSFADGTSWRVTSDQEQEALARADRASNAPACAESPDARKYLEQLETVELSSRVFDSYRSEEPNGTQSFSFTCALHRVNDSSVRARCVNRLK